MVTDSRYNFGRPAQKAHRLECECDFGASLACIVSGLHDVLKSSMLSINDTDENEGKKSNVTARKQTNVLESWILF